MRLSRPLLALTLSVCVAPAFAGAKVDYDKGVDFSKYRTYAWREGTPAASPGVQQDIEDAIDAQLQAKGLTRVEADADLHVITHTSSRAETLITADKWSYGGWPGWRGWGNWGTGISTSMVNVSKIPIGTVMVDLVDAEADRLVWRGIGEGTIPKKHHKLEAKIQRGSQKLFRDFPPSTE